MLSSSCLPSLEDERECSSSRFRSFSSHHHLRRPTTPSFPPPPTTLKNEHACSFSRVVDLCHHQPPTKTSVFARFQWWLLFPTTTTTNHPRKRARSLVFEGGCSFLPPPLWHHHQPPSKTSERARFRGRLLFPTTTTTNLP